jgi:hypothetical protein
MYADPEAVRTGVCYVVVSRHYDTWTRSMRVRMRMTDDLDLGSTAEVQVLGVDDACATLRAWMEGLAPAP